MQRTRSTTEKRLARLDLSDGIAIEKDLELLSFCKDKKEPSQAAAAKLLGDAWARGEVLLVACWYSFSHDHLPRMPKGWSFGRTSNTPRYYTIILDLYPGSRPSKTILNLVTEKEGPNLPRSFARTVSLHFGVGPSRSPRHRPRRCLGGGFHQGGSEPWTAPARPARPESVLKVLWRSY